MSAKQALLFFCFSPTKDMHLLLTRLKTNLEKKTFWMKLLFSHTELHKLLREKQKLVWYCYAL